MKKLFIVTSALNPSNCRYVSKTDRQTQTIDALKQLREKFSEDYILFTDGSPNEIDSHLKEEIKKYTNSSLFWNDDPEMRVFSEIGYKSASEALLLLKTIGSLKDKIDLQNFDRVFKLTSRTFLHDDIDFEKHNHENKFVFGQKSATWMSGHLKELIPFSLNTRFFSFDATMTDLYKEELKEIIQVILNRNVDTEHAHYFILNKDDIVELDSLCCHGIVARTGKTEFY